MPGVVCEPFPTLLVDLTQSKESLLSAIKKDTRYEIRRSEKSDGCVAEHIMQPGGLLDAFWSFYAVFAQQKGLLVQDSVSLERMCRAGTLVLSRIVRGEETLIWHAYYCTMGRARLLYSASLFRGLDSGQRNLVGRVNRHLHWHDILEFKTSSFHTYDFGGWSPPESGDAEKQRINQFKEEFGGRKTIEFNCVYAASLVGGVALAAKRLLGR